MVVVPSWPLDGSTALIVQLTPGVSMSVNDPSFFEMVLTVVSPVAVAVINAQAILAAEEFLASPWTFPAAKVMVDSRTPVAGTVMLVVVRTPLRSLAG
jgi:hypothetical protein